MSQYLPVLVSVIAVASIGALIAWLFLRTQNAGLPARLEEREKEVAAVRGELATVRDALLKAGQGRDRMTGMIEAERAGFTEKVALLEGAKAQLKEAFAAASQEALQSNNQAFLDLAQTKLVEFQRSAEAFAEWPRRPVDGRHPRSGTAPARSATGPGHRVDRLPLVGLVGRGVGDSYSLDRRASRARTRRSSIVPPGSSAHFT